MRKAIADQVAKYVAAHRTTSRLSQTELAEKVGVSRQTIAQIELAQTLPSLETLYELARALECEAFDLLPAVKQVR
ncbi:MAG: helix-turn-helix transcriptional regulator [Solirubrobacterales bacterium]